MTEPEPPAPPTVDISSEAVAAWVANKRQTNVGGEWWSTDMVEALAAERDRLRTFVRTARAIVQEYARQHPTHRWGEHWQDPMGAGAWLAAFAKLFEGAGDGGDPKVERT